MTIIIFFFIIIRIPLNQVLGKGIKVLLLLLHYISFFKNFVVVLCKKKKGLYIFF